MGQIMTGPFTIQLGTVTLGLIDSIGIAYTVDSEDKKTVQGHDITIFGSHKVEVKVSFLETDVATLAAVVPQYYVANGGILSSGETVSDPAGAIDLVPGGLNTSSVYSDLIISSAGTNGGVLRIMNCKSEITSISNDDKVRTVEVTFTGFSNAATIQLFKKGAISVIS